MTHLGDFAMFEQRCTLVRVLILIVSHDSSLLSNEAALY